MERLRVNLMKETDESYDIVIGEDLFADIARGLSNLAIDMVGIITDTTVKNLYGQKLFSLLKENGIHCIMVSIPPGEQSKTRENKAKIEDYLVQSGLSRRSVIIALGGGVVGDLAGFVASTYMRGIPFLQIPSSLLAMVDSSIGGKTGVDTPQGKNLVGTFYQPKKVFIDVLLLSTLAKEEIINGVAEMIKHAVIADEKYFVFLDDYMDRIMNLDMEVIPDAIHWSCKIKKDVIEMDETEENTRKILNFGHTIGHAIEKASDYSLKHGEAVLIGMAAETRIARKLGIANQVHADKILDLIHKTGHKISIGEIDRNQILENTRFDKKKLAGNIGYVLPRKPGKVKLDCEVDDGIVLEVLGEMR